MTPSRENLFEVHVTFGRGIHSKRRRQREKAARGGTSKELREWLEKVRQRMTEDERIQKVWLDQMVFGAGWTHPPLRDR